jgi:predicted RecA/RadA family phage recombinase
MAKAKIVSGEPTVANLITPDDVESGDVLQFGGSVFVAVGNGKEGDLVAFAISGGVYRVPISDNTNLVVGWTCRWELGEGITGYGSGDRDFGILLSINVATETALVFHNQTPVVYD